MIFSLLVDERERSQTDAALGAVFAALAGQHSSLDASRSDARAAVEDGLIRPADPEKAAEFDAAKERENWGAGEQDDMDVWGPVYEGTP